MRHEPVCYMAGVWTPVSRATVHLFDSGLMYGEIITETLRTFRRVPYQVERHLERMARSLSMARIAIDPAIDLVALIDELTGRNARAFELDDEILIKVDVTRGIFGYYRQPGEEYADFNLMLHPIRLPFERFAHQYEAGMAVAYPLTRQIPAACLDPRIKHRSRLYQGIAEREARDVDPQAAALLLDVDGHLAEGTGWNVFLVRGEQVLTPSLENCLEGVSRSVVLDLCRDRGLHVREASLTPYDLATADEAFATATSYCMLPITRAQSRPVGDGRPGPVTREVLRLWGDQVGVEIAQQACDYAARRAGSGVYA